MGATSFVKVMCEELGAGLDRFESSVGGLAGGGVE
jgi:hypothetical protein